MYITYMYIYMHTYTYVHVHTCMYKYNEDSLIPLLPADDNVSASITLPDLIKSRWFCTCTRSVIRGLISLVGLCAHVVNTVIPTEAEDNERRNHRKSRARPKPGQPE